MEPVSPIRELDRRVTDGIDVRLCWSPDGDELFVTVGDRKTGDAFEVAVRDGERPLEVFRHPYAFAALPGRRNRSRLTALDDALPVGPSGKRRWRRLAVPVPARRARAL
jgi:hypothetical protein